MPAAFHCSINLAKASGNGPLSVGDARSVACGVVREQNVLDRRTRCAGVGVVVDYHRSTGQTCCVAVEQNAAVDHRRANRERGSKLAPAPSACKAAGIRPAVGKIGHCHWAKMTDNYDE